MLRILQWRHYGRDGVTNYQHHDCLFNRLFKRRSNKTPKLHVTGLCAGNSPVTGEFPAQRASKAENISIWWRHHDTTKFHYYFSRAYALEAIEVNHLTRCDLDHGSWHMFIKVLVCCLAWRHQAITCINDDISSIRPWGTYFNETLIQNQTRKFFWICRPQNGTHHSQTAINSLFLYHIPYDLDALFHDDVIKWKHFPRYWPFVRGIPRSPVNSPHKGQWRGALMFSLSSAWIIGWVNNREAGDLRRHRAHYDVIVMSRSHVFVCDLVIVGFTHSLHSYVLGTAAIIRLPQCRWSNPRNMG